MFRSREIRHFTRIYILISVVFAVIGFAICTEAGALMFFAAASYGLAFFVFTRNRYQRIAFLSEQIDLVLHNAERLFIDNEEEGELSILQSEITKMTLRIREQNDRLRTEKMLLADSLADIAHQLRTPLTSMNLILSLLENNMDANERIKLLREAEELLMRMDWLITSLLKLSRLDAGVIAFGKESVRVNDLLRAAARPLLIPMDLHNITLHTDISDEAEITGDADWLSEAMQNILKNCMESVGDNGSIEIICEDTVLYTEIVIHDSGKGFNDEDIPRLFDRFYQGKDSGMAGYGIGLALCKMIVTAQGGTLRAANHPQGGAVFYIHFPK